MVHITTWTVISVRLGSDIFKALSTKCGLTTLTLNRLPQNVLTQETFQSSIIELLLSLIINHSILCNKVVLASFLSFKHLVTPVTVIEESSVSFDPTELAVHLIRRTDC